MKIDIGVIDYGMGNQGSLVNSLRSMGYRVSVARKPSQLKGKDLIMLPGVGAFPKAMQNLNKKGFSSYLLDLKNTTPIIGICLGMQLLTESSDEQTHTEGLGIIPGKVIQIQGKGWHIGWNKVIIKKDNSFLKIFNNRDFYFNHSFRYEGSERYQIAKSGKPYSCAAIIRKGSAYGVQFHPEKSQRLGKNLLSKLIGHILHA